MRRVRARVCVCACVYLRVPTCTYVCVGVYGPTNEPKLQEKVASDDKELGKFDVLTAASILRQCALQRPRMMTIDVGVDCNLLELAIG